MGRITTISLFVAICFIGVTYGMDCSFGGSRGLIGKLVNSCPIPIFGSSTASYCCPRPNRNYLECCEAGEFFGLIFGAIFVFVLFVGCCCFGCASCPFYHLCHSNPTTIIVHDPSGYRGNNGQHQTMAMQPHTGYTQA